MNALPRDYAPNFVTIKSIYNFSTKHRRFIQIVYFNDNDCLVCYFKYYTSKIKN